RRTRPAASAAAGRRTPAEPCGRSAGDSSPRSRRAADRPTPADSRGTTAPPKGHAIWPGPGTPIRPRRAPEEGLSPDTAHNDPPPRATALTTDIWESLRP